MSHLAEFREPSDFNDRLFGARAATSEAMTGLVGEICRRFPSTGRGEKSARIARLIEAEAWTDAALALIDLKLPQWQVRRLAYDEGEWHCALSRLCELPEWLDESIEAHHADLPQAILCAFEEAQAVAAPRSRTSVPAVPRDRNPLYEPVLSDDFG